MSTETAPAGMHLGAGARRSTRSSDVSANRKRKVQDDTDLIRTPVESKRRTVKAYVNKNGSRESNSSGEHDGARKSPPSPNRRKPRTPPKEMRSSDPLSDMIPPNMSPIDDLSIQSPAKEAPNGVNSSLPEAPSTMANLGESQTLAAENNTAETIQREASPVPMTEAIAEQNTPNHTIEAEISPSKSKIAVVAPKASPKGRAKRKAPAHSSSESNARRRTRTSTVPAGAPSPSETRSARQLPFANGGSVINLRSLPTKPASTNLTSGATDEVVGDGPPMNDVMLFDDEIRPTDDQDTIQQKRLVRAAKEEMLKIGEDFSKLYKRRVQLELDAIALEEKQLKAGTHPCFEELEAKYSALDNINLARKRLSREHAQIVCDASIKQANDTFIV
ncbi:hypothetical protein DFS34DRAFT_31497 [Phlyctochytrium arcticum]|nr:hypothetical protein DFS34DRAFT_31497 [Phlyctochytrium arcticum]